MVAFSRHRSYENVKNKKTDHKKMWLHVVGTTFAEFQLVTEDFVKTVVQGMPQKSCDLDPIPSLSFVIVWMKLFP